MANQWNYTNTNGIDLSHFLSVVITIIKNMYYLHWGLVEIGRLQKVLHYLCLQVLFFEERFDLDYLSTSRIISSGNLLGFNSGERLSGLLPRAFMHKVEAGIFSKYFTIGYCLNCVFS